MVLLYDDVHAMDLFGGLVLGNDNDEMRNARSGKQGKTEQENLKLTIKARP